ncbi:MAG TPA: FHA domain-containing protein, partial [Gemmataceae bacterium]|nr:FHA domain-containing protein [Gemmataceae bacterium]
MTATVTFQVIEGVDKGRIFRDLALAPFVTIGREEGNQLRLNDERVSRFHAKVQADNADIILTDLESTNGTRVNGHTVDIRRLRPGDRICLGRSVLLFGSNEEIAARMASLASSRPPVPPSSGTSYSSSGPVTIQAPTFATQFDGELDFDLNIQAPI